jgi:mannose-1-phosphate guanylyltransferase
VHTAFLLAAGLGTRLRPLTLHRPKALLPVCGAPMLDHALALVRAHGHRSVLVNAHHLWEQVAAWVVTRTAPGLQLAVQVELPDILGTGGGLRAALPGLADPVVVLNADILCDVDLGALRAAVPVEGAAMALRRLAPGESITPAEAQAGRVVAIGGIVGRVASEGGEGEAGTHFTGVHAMSKAALARIPEEGEQCVVRTAYRALVGAGLVAALPHGGTWIDIGRPADYLRANLDLLAGRVATALDPWTLGERGPGGSFVGADARLEGAVDACVVGAGARVPPGARLRRCVVWDGVEVPPGDHQDTVFHDGGALPVAAP